MLYKQCLYPKSNSVFWFNSWSNNQDKLWRMIRKSFLKGLLPLHPFIHCKSWPQSKENDHVIKHNYLRCLHKWCYSYYCTLPAIRVFIAWDYLALALWLKCWSVESENKVMTIWQYTHGASSKRVSVREWEDQANFTGGVHPQTPTKSA